MHEAQGNRPVNNLLRSCNEEPGNNCAASLELMFVCCFCGDLEDLEMMLSAIFRTGQVMLYYLSYLRVKYSIRVKQSSVKMTMKRMNTYLQVLEIWTCFFLFCCNPRLPRSAKRRKPNRKTGTNPYNRRDSRLLTLVSELCRKTVGTPH